MDQGFRRKRGFKKRTMKNYCRTIVVGVSFFFLPGCVTQGAPELKNLEEVTYAYVQNSGIAAEKKGSKIIYIGVYGGELPSWSKAEGFDPQRWPPYQKIDPFDDNGLNDIAFKESLLNSIGLRIARQFPDSVTFVLRGDADVVADVVRDFYSPGDRIYLVGFSNGGGAIVDGAYLLKEQNIPVQMTAQIDSIGSGDFIPSNVGRGFNFYSRGDFFCPGKKRMAAEDPTSTQVTNELIPDPQGPFTWGFCTIHRNMDSDPRVWKPILDYVVRSESALGTRASLRE
jgi:hypothetical protein